MDRRSRATLLALLIPMVMCTSAAGEATAQEASSKRIAPDWLSVDAESRKVSLYIVAGLTTANSAWNFNGYANGEMTITVPLDWQVEIRFTTRDANYAHSVGIVEIEEEIPISGDRAKIALPRAFSLQFSRGFLAPKEDVFGFKANRAGRFMVFCGVQGHAVSGMWDYFVVSEETTEPYVEIRESS